MYFPTATAIGTAMGVAVAWVQVHRARDGLHRAILEVVEGLLVKEGLFFTKTLLEELALVPELDDRLRVGVERGDGGGHAAGERSPCHAERRQNRETFHLSSSR